MTVVEIIVATALMLVVAAGPLIWIIVSVDQQNQVSSTTFATRQAEIGLEAITRDLHQAYNAQISNPSASATPVTISTSGSTTTLSLYLPPAPGTAVTWTCTTGSSGNCTRTAGTTTRTFLAGLSSITLAGTSSSGASTSTNPAYVGITIAVNPISQLDSGGTNTVAAGQPITVQGGADVRSY
jgi:hypothetical protein